MKTITMFLLANCPYCKEAINWMDQLKKEDPRYEDISITMIDEGVQPNVANKYDYYLVPTYYINDTKIHEGIATKGIVQEVFEKALT